MNRRSLWAPIFAFFGLVFAAPGSAQVSAAGEKFSPGIGSFSEINPRTWDKAKAAHLLERAGFGDTPEKVEALTQLSPRAAVRQLVYGQTRQTPAEFDPSPIDAPGMDPFPPSRPATTEAAM